MAEQKSYAELLRDPRWQQKRLRIFERDGWSCCRCGDGDSELQVDHRYYVRGKKPWEYPDDALQTLCAKCHREVSEERGQTRGGRPWRVMRGAPVDLYDGECWTGPFAPGPIEGTAFASFSKVAYEGGDGLAWSAYHTGWPRFYVVKEVNNGTTYVVARAGDVATALRILADTGVDSVMQWERIA